MSWKRESFRLGRDIVARFGYRGNTLCIYLPLDPAIYEGSKYKVEDASVYAAYADTPCMYRLKNERRVRYAAELIASLMGAWEVGRIERTAEEYDMPYEETEALIGKGLIKVENGGGTDVASVQRFPAEEVAAAELPEGPAAELPEEDPS